MGNFFSFWLNPTTDEISLSPLPHLFSGGHTNLNWVALEKVKNGPYSRYLLFFKIINNFFFLKLFMI